MINAKKGYTFLELMVTVSVLSIGIVGIYKTLLVSLDYQRQLSCRLYASGLLEHEIAVLQNQFQATGELAAEENGKVVDVVLDRRTVAFQFSIGPGTFENNILGLLPVTVLLSWPDNNRTINLKRDIYLVNLNARPAADAPSSDRL